MKLITFKIFFLSFLIFSINVFSMRNKQSTVDAPKSSKFLFMYKYPQVKNEKDHKLNVFTYKNVLLSNDQIVYFESTNEGDDVNI